MAGCSAVITEPPIMCQTTMLNHSHMYSLLLMQPPAASSQPFSCPAFCATHLMYSTKQSSVQLSSFYPYSTRSLAANLKISLRKTVIRNFVPDLPKVKGLFIQCASFLFRLVARH